MNKPPPRPISRQRLPSYSDDPQPTLFDEWERDRADGITLRATRKIVDDHLDQEEKFHAELVQRLAKLEANEERNAQDRAWGGGTGQFRVVPPAPAMPQHLMAPEVSQRPKPMKPWYAQEPFLKPIKYVLFGIAVLILREIYIRVGVPFPHP